MMRTMTATDDDTSPRRLRTAIIIASVLIAAAASVVLLTSGPSEQATTKGVTATLHLPGSPDFAVFVPGGLWVSIHGSDAKENIEPDGQLLHLNLATGTVQQTVPLRGATSNLALDGNSLIADPGIAGTSVGVAPGELIAVDTRTGRVLARRRQQISGGPMVIGDGALWEIQEKHGDIPTTLQEFNPATLAPIAPPLALSPTSNVLGLAYGGGYLWASAANAGEVLRIDPATRAITRAHVGGFPIGIVLAGGSVWIIDNSNATIKHLDPSTLRVIGKSVSLPSGSNFYLGATDGYVFVADDSDGTITRIDTRTGESAGRPIRIAPASTTGFGSAYAIAPAGTAIWATSPSTDTISRIEANP